MQRTNTIMNVTLIISITNKDYYRPSASSCRTRLLIIYIKIWHAHAITSYIGWFDILFSNCVGFLKMLILTSFDQQNKLSKWYHNASILANLGCSRPIAIFVFRLNHDVRSSSKLLLLCYNEFKENLLRTSSPRRWSSFKILTGICRQTDLKPSVWPLWKYIYLYIFLP